MEANQAQTATGGCTTRERGHHHPNLLIVSDVRLFSEGLAGALERHPLLSVAGQCRDSREALAKLAKLPPDILLLDASLPDGVALVGDVRKLAPTVLVVVVALNETVDVVIAWAEAGVAGYIPKTAGLSDVVSFLLRIKQGEQVCSPAIAAGLIRRLHALPTPSAAPRECVRLPALTARETQITDLIAAGLSNKDIARRLNIGVSTTKSHVHNLLSKLDVQQRSQVAIRVREHHRSLAREFEPSPHPLTHPKVDITDSNGRIR
jgi:two-component system nitrate/nitrite response regulator NarL